MNFKDEKYKGNYAIKFPHGVWKEVLNSNNTAYGGDGTCQNNSLINALDANKSVNICIPKQSIVIFKKIS